MTTVRHTPPIKLAELERYALGDLVSQYLVGPAAEVASISAGRCECRVRGEDLIEASDRLRVLSLLAAIANALDGVPVPVEDIEAIVDLMQRTLAEALEAGSEHAAQYEEGRLALAQLQSAKGDKDEIARQLEELRRDRATALEDMAHAGACRVVLDALKEVA